MAAVVAPATDSRYVVNLSADVHELTGFLQMAEWTTLQGYAQSATKIQSHNLDNSRQCVVVPGNNCACNDLTIDCDINQATPILNPIGSSTIPAGGADPPFINFTANRCTFIGAIDVLYINRTGTNETITATFNDCTFVGTFDLAVQFACGPATVTNFNRCTMNADTLNTTPPASQRTLRGIYTTTGNAFCDACTFIASGKAGFSRTCYGAASDSDPSGGFGTLTITNSSLLARNGSTSTADLAQLRTGVFHSHNNTNALGGALTTVGVINDP